MLGLRWFFWFLMIISLSQYEMHKQDAYATVGDVEGIKVFADQKRVEVEGIVSKELGKYEQLQGAIEYLACAEGGKAYESILVLNCKPKDLYDSLIQIGLKPGASAYDDESGKHILPKGDKVRIFVEWKNTEGKTVSFRAEDLIYNKKTKKTMQYVDWVFVGSQFIEDPETGEKVLQAELTKNIISTHHGDRTVIIQNPLPEAVDESIYLVNDKLLPKPGTGMRLIVDGSPFIQLYVLISGEVQGVGFRDFTKRMADQMGVYGYVKNLPDGNVEAMLEGRESDVAKLLEKLRVGPESAKVTDVKTEKKKFTGKYKDFQIYR